MSVRGEVSNWTAASGQRDAEGSAGAMESLGKPSVFGVYLESNEDLSWQERIP